MNSRNLSYDKATLIVVDILKKKGLFTNVEEVLTEYNNISMKDISKHNKKVIE